MALTITIPLHYRVMLVKGDNRGNALICKRIRGAKSDQLLRSKTNTNIPLDSTYVVQSDLELEAVLSKQNSLIFIDRFDILAERNSRIVDFINGSNNNFILMYNGKTGGIKANMSSFVKLDYSVNGDQVTVSSGLENAMDLK